MRTVICDPQSPWQRGGIENSNGLIRRDLPSRNSFPRYTDDDVAAVILNLNSTPRRGLGVRTPMEALAAERAVAPHICVQQLPLLA